MLPEEWLSMGGETCNDCSTCIASELCVVSLIHPLQFFGLIQNVDSAFVQAYPETADEIFESHWYDLPEIFLAQSS